jgi:NADH-quinone oxidoreductase subunit N
VNNFTIFFMVLVLFLSFFTSILSFHFFRKSIENTGEFYVSFLLSILGAQILISSTHFVSLFLGFEIMTVSLYILIPYLRTNRF